MKCANPDIRESKSFYAFNGESVTVVTGYSCKPHNPDIWWVPELGYSMSEKHHLFFDKREAVTKAIDDTEKEIEELKSTLEHLKSQAL